MITLLTLALIHIDGFHMPIKRYTSKGQAHDQEAVVQRTLHLLSSFFLSFSTNCMRDRYILTQSNDPPQCRIWNTLIKFSKWNFLQCNQFTCLHRDGDTSETTWQPDLMKTGVTQKRLNSQYYRTWMCLAFSTIPWAPSPIRPRIW